jgi:hypothetical protein
MRISEIFPRIKVGHDSRIQVGIKNQNLTHILMACFLTYIYIYLNRLFFYVLK